MSVSPPSQPSRFWGTIVAVKPRLVLVKFENDTRARCDGHILTINGTRQSDPSLRPEAGGFTVAVGPATQEKRALQPGDLVRGDAHAVPPDQPDTSADLYRVGTLRILARAGEAGAAARPALDPPRSEPPLTPAQAEAAPRPAPG